MQLLQPWFLALLATAFLLGAACARLLRSRKRGTAPLPLDFALLPRPVFSNDERRVYQHLRDALPQHVVLSKLPLVRFCQPADPRQVRYWFDLLGASHVSFAICSASGRVLAAVDLEGPRGSSLRAVTIKRSVLEACRVRYLRCTAGALPSPSELQRLVPPVPGATHNTTVGDSRNRLASTVASRRLERDSIWQESRNFRGPDSITGPASEPGHPADSHWPPRDSRSADDQAPPADGGAIVSDHDRPPLRH